MYNLFNWVNIEPTSSCNKNCACCGRRKIELEYPELQTWGHMPLPLAKRIADQLPDKILVSLHNNGEPLLHPEFGAFVRLFHRQIRVLNTNGKLLLEKAPEFIGQLDVVTVSLLPDDPDGPEQLAIVTEFIQRYGISAPRIIFRCTGPIEETRLTAYRKFNCLMVDRVLHSPMGSFGYTHTPIIPEYGICNEILNHPAIDRFGNMSICVRFDPTGCGRLGNLQETPIKELWYNQQHQDWLQCHINGHRELVPLCKTCEFWGCPRGK